MRAVEQHPRSLQRDNRVVEGGFLRIARDLLDFIQLFPDPFFDRWFEVLVFDPIERWNVIRQIAFRQ